MISKSIDTAEQSLQSHLNRHISQLYQHFLVGDLEPIEFSEMIDDLISLHAVTDVLHEAPLCQA